MAPAPRMAAPVLFLLLVLIATEMGRTAGDEEGRYCLSQSHKFKGMCLSSNNCEKVCATESFPAGECKMENALRKCFCKKPC
ncbi:hypothetical protein QOZ80_2BG0193820 [Eleusine coracana subsp. coracana]|nr:hypothetical protein QOZ80_2BG0193820 [Eleusine coracana subsp. coracana]